jgi:hypothetical protein
MASELRNTFIKQPYEVLPLEVNFGSLTVLPKGAKYIELASASAKKWKRSEPDTIQDATNEFLVLENQTPKVAILSPSKCKIRLHVNGGDNGYDYQVTVRVRFDSGAQLEEELYIRVTER